MEFTLFTAFLFFVWWMSAVSVGDGLEADCCLTVTNTRIPVENIEDYSIQESTGVCLIKAVRFLTKKDKVICSNPNDTWTIRAIDYVNKRIKNKGPSEEATMCCTSTTNTIPTNKTPGTETETSTGTTEPPMVTRIEMSGPETEITKPTTRDHLASCCLTVTNTRIPADTIMDYDIQDTALCSIRAIRFITVENNTICSSPEEEWVQDYIQSLNKRKTTEETDKKEFNNDQFCLKKKQATYFCVKQP